MMRALRPGASRGWASVGAVLVLGLAAGYLTASQPARGTVEGIVVAEETGQPIPGAKVQLVPDPVKTKGGKRAKTETDKRGRFAFKDVLVGAYAITVRGQARALEEYQFEVSEGRVAKLRLQLSPQSPSLELVMHQQMFIPDERVEVVCKGYTRATALQVQCFRVDPMKLSQQAQGSLHRYLGIGWDEDAAAAIRTQRPDLRPLPAEEHKIVARDAEGIFYQRIHPKVPEPGLYLVRVSAGDLRQVGWFSVTRLGLVVKHGGGKVLVYAADLKSGQPISGCEVRLVSDAKTVAEGRTSDDGLVEFIPAVSGERELTVTGLIGGSFASASVYAYQGPGEEPLRVYMYTDRPVYRPGDHVYFKGIARRLEGDHYAVPAPQPVHIEVYDDRHILVHCGSVQMSRQGSFWGEFDLPKGAGTGDYDLTAYLAGVPYTRLFKVAAYRKPEFQVKLTPGKEWYVRGDELQIAVEAKHYFGAPVANATIRWTVYRQPCWWDLTEEEEFENIPPEIEEEGEYYEGPEYGAEVSEGTTHADESGRAIIKISTAEKKPRKKPRPEEWPEVEEHDQWYTVDVTVSDPARHEVSETARVRVTGGEFHLSLQAAQSVVEPGTAVPVTMTALDYEKRPRPNVRLQVEAGPAHWHEQGLQHEVRFRQSLVTDRDGHASVTITPDSPGETLVKVSCTDARGNVITRHLYIWVSSEEVGEFEYRYPELELVPDKKQYEEGDTAKVLVNTKQVGATALVTIEGTTILDRWLQRLATKSTTLTIPLRPQYVPGVYVNVSFVRNKQFATQSKRLLISTKRRELKVTVTPGQACYGPGDQVTCGITVTDATGRPVAAELSLAVVNEAIYHIREEPKPDILGFFYPLESHEVQTSFSFPEIYLSPEEKGGAGEGAVMPATVREKFRDTAFWTPVVTTDARGTAQVQFKLPDDITAWRATACAHTPQTVVGTGRASFTAKKDLLVRLSAPMFFTQQDRCRVAAIVHNESDKPQRATVRLEAEGLPRAESKPVIIEPGGRYTFEHDISLASALSLSLLGWVKADSGLEDAMRLTVPVTPHARLLVECRTGVTTGSASEHLEVHQKALEGRGGLVIRLAPSLASSLLGSLKYLATYPYGCTEQTLSSFLPDVMVARALKELGLSQPELETKLADMVLNGLMRLYHFQHEDGGWGWWEHDDTQLWMTAYVVFGMLEAKRAGFQVHQKALEAGLQRLEQAMGSKEERAAADEAAYARYVLALAERKEAARRGLDQRLRQPRGPRGDYVTAVNTLTYAALGEGDRAAAELDRLWQRATRSEATVQWGGSADQWSERSAPEVTALGLLATYRVRPDHPDLPRVIRWLMLQRQGDHWESTRDTAMVLYAMTEYLKTSRELRPDYSVEVKLNGKRVQTLRMTPERAANPEAELRLALEELARGPNDVELVKTGEGLLYYALELSQYVAEEENEAALGGTFTVERKYYKLTPITNSEGGIEFESSKEPVRQVRCGDTVRCVLWVTNPQTQQFVILEDPLPAGCDLLERRDRFEWQWYDWLSDVDFRDDKVCAFSRTLTGGKHKFRYDMRAVLPGEFHIMPTTVYNMYLPGIRGTGAESRLTIREE